MRFLLLLSSDSFNVTCRTATLLERPKAFELADADLRSCMASLSVSGFCSAAVNAAALSRHPLRKFSTASPWEHLVADIGETLGGLDEDLIRKVIQRLCFLLFQGLKLSSCSGRQLHQPIAFVQRVSQCSNHAVQIGADSGCRPRLSLSGRPKDGHASPWSTTCLVTLVPETGKGTPASLVAFHRTWAALVMEGHDVHVDHPDFQRKFLSLQRITYWHSASDPCYTSFLLHQFLSKEASDDPPCRWCRLSFLCFLSFLFLLRRWWSLENESDESREMDRLLVFCWSSAWVKNSFLACLRSRQEASPMAFIPVFW